MHKFLLRSRREALGLSALQLANQARCPVELVVHTEFGIAGGVGENLRHRLARAYRLAPERFNRLARHAEARLTRQLVDQRRAVHRLIPPEPPLKRAPAPKVWPRQLAIPVR